MGISFKHERQGFTIIEVMLFLALSGFMLVGILAGTGSSIANQRYKDSVQDALDMIKDAYSFVSDTEVPEYNENSEGRGRSNRVVYGALLTLKRNTIDYTTIVGDDYFATIDNTDEVTASKLMSMGDVQLLKALNADNVVCEVGLECHLAGAIKSQKLKWNAVLYGKTSSVIDPISAIMIIRAPRTGAIRTYVFEDSEKESIGLKNIGDVISNPNTSSSLGSYLVNSSDNSPRFVSDDVHICIDSDGTESYAGNRRMIIIHKNAQSQTDVELMDMDGEEQCER